MIELKIARGALRILLFHNSILAKKILPFLCAIGFKLRGRSLESVHLEPSFIKADGAIDYFSHDRPGESLIVLRQIRDNFPSSLIVAIGDYSSERDRIHAYLAGADSCFSEKTSLEEIAARLQSRRADMGGRHVEEASIETGTDVDKGSRSRSWTLKNSGWLLRASDGAEIELARRERVVMLRFAESTDLIVSRDDFLERLSNCRKRNRAVDVIISRLRKRAADCGVSLPIRSVRGQGYSFTEVLYLEKADSDL